MYIKLVPYFSALFKNAFYRIKIYIDVEEIHVPFPNAFRRNTAGDVDFSDGDSHIC